MPFPKIYLNDDLRDTGSNVFPIWLNEEEKLLVLEVGLRMRQCKVGTIFKEALVIARAKLIVEEEMSEILLNNERRNKRSGLEELEILKSELVENLKKNDKTNG